MVTEALALSAILFTADSSMRTAYLVALSELLSILCNN